MTANSFYPQIQQLIEQAIMLSANLPAERRERLNQIKSYLKPLSAENQLSQLIFICTHNSRRSHFGQIWAKVMGDFFGFENLQTYSGGTEATAFNPNAIAALQHQGFQVFSDQPESSNPIYRIQYGQDLVLELVYSKKYDAPLNPRANFCAVMTCTEADEACPIVFGASSRVSLPYEDPKKSDGTALQNATYQERSKQIATEMAYLFSTI